MGGLGCWRAEAAIQEITHHLDTPATLQSPMFPIVRRVSTSPLLPHPRIVVTDDPMGTHGAGVLDRDFCYPSFLEGIPSRPRPPAPRTMVGIESSSRPRLAPLRVELGPGSGPGAAFSQTWERPARAASQDGEEADTVQVKFGSEAGGVLAFAYKTNS